MIKFVIFVVVAVALPYACMGACDAGSIGECMSAMQENMPADPANNIEEACQTTKTMVECMEDIVNDCPDGDMKTQVQQQIAQAKPQIDNCGEGSMGGKGCSIAEMQKCTADYTKAMPANPQDDIPQTCVATRGYLDCFDGFMDNCPADMKDQFQGTLDAQRAVIDEHCGSTRASLSLSALLLMLFVLLR